MLRCVPGPWIKHKEETSLELSIIKDLISDLVRTNRMLLVIDSGGAVSEMYADGLIEPQFADEWVTIESKSWHIHLNASKVDGVQFVEAEDNVHTMPKMYYVRFSGREHDTLLRFYFPNPWLDDDEQPAEFQPEKLQVFETFRDRYVGKGGVEFVKRD